MIHGSINTLKIRINRITEFIGIYKNLGKCYCTFTHPFLFGTYEGCPSILWTFVITRDSVPVIQSYFKDVFIYLWEQFCLNKGEITV